MAVTEARAVDRRAEIDIAADTAPPARQALLVLGMHRSGTSALTRVLGLCGGTLPRHPGSGGSDNVLGHWEPEPIVEAHDRFLKSFGSGWEAIADYPPTIFASEAAAACRRSLTELARNEFGDAPLFVLKDPRVSRLVPLWRPVLSGLGVTPRIVIVVRNPLEIAQSLKARNGWSTHRATIVWLRYLLTAERDTRDLRRCFVSYGQLMSDWRATIARLSDALGIEFAARDAGTERQIDDFIRQDLRHHRDGNDALFQRADIAGAIKQAYRCFRDAAETGTVDHAALDRIAADLNEADAALERMTRTGTRLAPLREIGHGPNESEMLTALMLARLEQANDTAERSENLVREMRASWSWRFTKPLRALGRTAGRLIGK